MKEYFEGRKMSMVVSGKQRQRDREGEREVVSITWLVCLSLGTSAVAQSEVKSHATRHLSTTFYTRVYCCS